MTYRPKFVKQGDGSTYQWQNCVAASAAMDLDRDTLGVSRTTGARVRQLTGDTSGGLTLDQADAALSKGWPGRDHLDVRSKITWSQAMAQLDAGQGILLLIRYAPLSGTKYDGSPGFTGNHGLWLNERAADNGLGFDPLCDGRRAGIPQAPLWYPESLLKQAAGLLEVGAQGQRLGAGYAQLGFSRDTEPAYRIAAASAGSFWRYYVTAGNITGRTRMRTKGPWSVPCTSPHRFPWPGILAEKRTLVKVTKGYMTGWYLAPSDSLLELRVTP